MRLKISAGRNKVSGHMEQKRTQGEGTEKAVGSLLPSCLVTKD
jgi:hypothetical protein